MKKIITLLFLLFAGIVKADPYFETGPTFYLWPGLRPEFTNGQAYIISQHVGHNYEVGLVGITSQLYSYYEYTCGKQKLCYKIIPQNYAIRVSKDFYLNDWNFGLGLAYWKDSSIIFPQKQTFELTIGYRVSENTEFRLRHYSNADQTYPNIGLNLITIEHNF